MLQKSILEISHLFKMFNVDIGATKMPKIYTECFDICDT